MQERKKQGEEKGKNRGFMIFSIAVFMMILVFPSIAWLLLGVMWQNGECRLEHDLDENRNKAPFPQVFGPAYTEELEQYYNDRLPFRSMIILANRNLVSLLEKPYDDLIAPCLVKWFYEDFEEQEIDENADLNDEEVLEAVEEQKEISGYFPPKLHNKATIEGRDKWLFFALENSLEDYLGSNVLSQEELDGYLSGMKELERICSEKGKQLFFFIPPNKEQVYSEFMPAYKISDQYKRARRLVDYVRANSEIKIIYPIEELMAAKEQWQMYFKTDTHWNNAGAFIGTQALYSLMGISTTSLSDLTAEERAFDSGDLIRMGNLKGSDYEGDLNYNIYYKLYVDVTMEEGENFTSDICSTVSTSENQCSLVIVGDSFRINMGQFLSKDFGKCMLVNSFYMNEPSAVDAIKNADIIVIESVERMNEKLPELMASVGSILEQ